jgi:haloalkane dehalogenase
MEAIVQPITWTDWPENVRPIFQGFRDKDGETMVLEKNLFVENVLPRAILLRLSEESCVLGADDPGTLQRTDLDVLC